MSQSRSQATSSQFVNTQVANKILKHCSKKSDAYKDEDEEERKVLARKADEVVNYILFNNLSVNKPVVRRADINKFILGDHSRSYKDVMVMVKRRLSDVFGLCLVDIDGSDTGEKYGLKCKYEYDPLSSKLNSECKPTLSSYESSNEIDHELNEQFKYSMIMISLALILMNENEIEANLFWDSLKRLDINPEEKKHKYLGDVKKYFTSDLTKEGYLEVEKISSLDASTEKFKAGYRSKLEISKSKILEFVCRFFFLLIRFFFALFILC